MSHYTFSVSFSSGGNSKDHEDEEEDHKRPAADGAGGDPQEHVLAFEEDDQGTDRVAHRAEVHAA